MQLARPSDDALPPLVREARFQYEFRARVLESLDVRLVAVLALCGVLLAMPLDVNVGFRAVAAVLSVAAAIVGVVGMWPRDFPAVNVAALHEGVGNRAAVDVDVQVLGLLMASIEIIGDRIGFKSMMLTVSFALVLLAAVAYAAGMVWGGGG